MHIDHDNLRSLRFLDVAASPPRTLILVQEFTIGKLTTGWKAFKGDGGMSGKEGQLFVAVDKTRFFHTLTVQVFLGGGGNSYGGGRVPDFAMATTTSAR